MPRSALLCLTLALAAPAAAEDATEDATEVWRLLEDDGITAALAARVLQYEDGAVQNFFQDGRTLYEADERESWGKWWVEADSYCSAWPPSDTSACHAVAVRGLEVRFTGTEGTVTVGRYVDL